MLSLVEALAVTVSDLSKLLGGLGPVREKLMNFSTVLGAVGVAREAPCPPTAFAAQMFSHLSKCGNISEQKWIFSHAVLAGLMN